jgi:hypothetical protein
MGQKVTRASGELVFESPHVTEATLDIKGSEAFTILPVAVGAALLV